MTGGRRPVTGRRPTPPQKPISSDPAGGGGPGRQNGARARPWSTGSKPVKKHSTSARVRRFKGAVALR